MKIKLVSISHKLPDWVEEGYQEYTSRFDKSIQFTCEQIPPITRKKSDINRKKQDEGFSSEVQQVKREEGEKLLEKIHKDDHVICFDHSGTQWNSIELSRQLEAWLQRGQNLSFIVGGPDGLDTPCLTRANQSWSLSTLTFPHTLIKILFAEQLYRAWSILKQHPYHR